VIHSQNVTIRWLTTLLLAAFLAGCGKSSSTNPSLTIAVNAGVEGTALKTAAQEWGKQTGTKIEVVELPYNNLFEKLLMDLTSRTGSYDVVMMDDPWFPKMVEGGNLAQLPVHAQGERFQESGMREICTSGSTRGE
jgi:multiple sugar transport system substrate-binding protein